MPLEISFDAMENWREFGFYFLSVSLRLAKAWHNKKRCCWDAIWQKCQQQEDRNLIINTERKLRRAVQKRWRKGQNLELLFRVLLVWKWMIYQQEEPDTVITKSDSWKPVWFISVNYTPFLPAICDPAGGPISLIFQNMSFHTFFCTSNILAKKFLIYFLLKDLFWAFMPFCLEPNFHSF